MKRIVIIVLFIILIMPVSVKANIRCNDGTTSPSCMDCHQGCCSWHDGCLKKGNSDTVTNVLIITGIVGAAAYGINKTKKK